jgi:hypothetical protein
MRAHAEEMNRLNRERRASDDAWRAELAKVEKQIQGMVEAIKEGMFHTSLRPQLWLDRQSEEGEQDDDPSEQSGQAIRR